MTLYKSDICSIFKRAQKLTAEACWQSSLEKQHLNLALKNFDDSTSAGLLAFIIDLHAAHARLLHGVSCANNNRFAVIVCFGSAFYASGMREKLEIFEFLVFFKF